MSRAIFTGRAAAGHRPRQPGTRRAQRALAAVEVVTGAAALAGGVLLAAAPDGRLLRADPGVLTGTPFTGWRLPGLLLAALAGGGCLFAGWWQSAGPRPGAGKPGRYGRDPGLAGQAARSATLEDEWLISLATSALRCPLSGSSIRSPTRAMSRRSTPP